MKLERNIGDSWRVLIPQEVRIEMNLKPGQPLIMESYPEEHKIILLFKENDSESNLDAQNDDKEHPL